MSYSLQLNGGDLTVGGPGGLGTVTGPQKLLQDLRKWILTSRGSNPTHPEYGSTLDGGIAVDGSSAPSSIGQRGSRERLASIELELRRILQEYQAQQLARLQREAVDLRGKNTFAPGEILYDITDVKVIQYGDVALARITITTQSGQQVTLAQPV